VGAAAGPLPELGGRRRTRPRDPAAARPQRAGTLTAARERPAWGLMRLCTAACTAVRAVQQVAGQRLRPGPGQRRARPSPGRRAGGGRLARPGAGTRPRVPDRRRGAQRARPDWTPRPRHPGLLWPALPGPGRRALRRRPDRRDHRPAGPAARAGRYRGSGPGQHAGPWRSPLRQGRYLGIWYLIEICRSWGSVIPRP